MTDTQMENQGSIRKNWHSTEKCACFMSDEDCKHGKIEQCCAVASMERAAKLIKTDLCHWQCADCADPVAEMIQEED